MSVCVYEHLCMGVYMCVYVRLCLGVYVRQREEMKASHLYRVNLLSYMNLHVCMYSVCK